MRGVFLVAGSLVLLACGRDASGLGPAATDTLDLPDIPMTARRPTAHIYMERTSDRCSVYALDGVVKTPGKDEACPEDLQLGERIRIAGMTCFRDGETTARSLPVVCPAALLRFERSFRVRTAESASPSPSAATSAH